MWAIPTVIVLLLLGPVTLLGFVVVAVVPTLYVAMHGRLGILRECPGPNPPAHRKAGQS